jgi:hypothetical protein
LVINNIWLFYFMIIHCIIRRIPRCICSSLVGDTHVIGKNIG